MILDIGLIFEMITIILHNTLILGDDFNFSLIQEMTLI